MPIYEYRCQACRKRTSALLATWSSADPPCSNCGSTNVHRLVSTFATVRGGEDGGDSDFDDFDDADGGEGHDHMGGDDFGGDDDW